MFFTKQDLIFSIEKAEGSIFLLPEVLINGLIGLLVVGLSREKLSRKVTGCISLLSHILSKYSDTKINHDYVSDFLEIKPVLGKIKHYFRK